MSTPYTSNFFAAHETRSRSSAAQVVPLVLEHVPAASVVDVGCGIGTWLTEFQASGVQDFLGVDGDYVSREQLLIDRERFQSHDLSQPLTLDRRFDLASCLEVAEHLPDASSQTLVDSLVGLAPVVLFSAAIPHQQGSDHVNEQWPDYWHARFADRDYVAVDALRRKLWRNPEVACWYRQNLLFYVDRKSLRRYPRLQTVFAADGDVPPLSLVHPEHYLELYNAVFDRMKKSQCLAMRVTMQLREINLAAFPDWSQAPEVLLQQMRTLCNAIAAHPQQTRVSLVLHMGPQPEIAAKIAEQANREVPLPPDTPPHLMPAVRGAGGSFGPDQWEVLLECCQARIMLPGEATATIKSLGADRLPAISLNALAAQQPLKFPALTF
jgi:SAM-dependent methyltransferase